MQSQQYINAFGGVNTCLMISDFPYCLEGLSQFIPLFAEGVNSSNKVFGENEVCRSSHDSTSQGSYCNSSFYNLMPAGSLNSKCMELNRENSQIGSEGDSILEPALTGSFISIRDIKISPSACQIKKNMISLKKDLKEKPKGKVGNKAKIPQKLIENRRREILSSLKKVTDPSKEVIKAVPRISTGSKRGSSFRGVSVNGKKWQVMVMGFGKKRYYGGIKDQNEAAQLYDKYAILTQGIGAKTNFGYTKDQILSILRENLKFE